MTQEIMEERFLASTRWEMGNECLNLVDINQPPENYNNSLEAWVNELTTFINTYPLEWESIKHEYDYYVLRLPGTIHIRSDLKYTRTDDGYLRVIGEKDIFLRIRCSQGGMLPYVLRLADKIISSKWLNFDTYHAYCKLQVEKRKKHISYLQQIYTSYLIYKMGFENIWNQLKGLETDWLKAEIEVQFEEDYDSSAFNGRDVYIDIMNYTYTVL